MLDTIGHKTQNEDKQNKKNFNTENQKYEQHRPHQKIGALPRCPRRVSNSCLGLFLIRHMLCFPILRSYKLLSVIKKMKFYAKVEKLIFRNGETVRDDDSRIIVGMNST